MDIVNVFYLVIWVVFKIVNSVIFIFVNIVF